MFQVESQYKPTGDQPQAIEKLSAQLKQGITDNILLGVTGSGKTFTASKVIEEVNKPTLVITPNKTLAAQLYQEFREFFPHNAAHFFTSYYDYYQPEAYIPQNDTYIEKDAKINQTIDRMRHAAVQDVLTRDDVIVVASVSCIYNLGSPDYYRRVSLTLKQGQRIQRSELMRRLAQLQYERNDVDFAPGTARVRGDVVEVFLVTGEEMLRIELFGDEIDGIWRRSTETNSDIFESEFEAVQSVDIYPAQFWVTPEDTLDIALENIRLELGERLQELKNQGKTLEAHRLEQRTAYDLEMLQETGYCHGVENYSRHLEFREPNAPPYTLLDYFAHGSGNGQRQREFLVFIDESHLTCPQINAMHTQDRARKNTLVEHGFRLPSCVDNRPLTYEEFEERAKQRIYVSATPAAMERERTKNEHIVEQLVRPTGLLEPEIDIRPTGNQVADLIKEAQKRAEKEERTLVVTLTKRLAEALTEHLRENGLRTEYLHSEIKTLDRPESLARLRSGEVDAMVGINLLREGLDLPEVSLIAILDADKEGFLRSETTLIQTMGRAARHVEGTAILYADEVTGSMRRAIDEIERRRRIQREFNKQHGITPQPIVKDIRDWQIGTTEETIETEMAGIEDVDLLKKEMREAAEQLDFERAAQLRDKIKSLEKNSK